MAKSRKHTTRKPRAAKARAAERKSGSPNRYVCQKCRNKIPIVDLEGVFHEQLKHFFFSPEEIGNQLKKADEVLVEKERLIGVLEAERQKLATEMDRTYRLYLADKLTVDGFGDVYQPLEKRKKQLEDELPNSKPNSIS